LEKKAVLQYFSAPPSREGKLSKTPGEEGDVKQTTNETVGVGGSSATSEFVPPELGGA